MIHTQLDVTLTLEGPVLSSSTAPGAYGVDKPVVRHHRGHAVLPIKLIKGRLRQSLEELTSAAGPVFQPNLRLLLGSRAPVQGDVETSVDPSRGRLEFSGFSCLTSEREGFRHRIQIDARRGAAAKGALLVAESPFGSGEPVQFVGAIQFWSASVAEADEVASQIQRGLLWTMSFGSGRTVGFGRLLDLGVKRTDCSTSPASGGPTVTSEGFDLVISPNAPFCFASHRQVANLFESSTVIPGGALKGSLAETWAAMLGAKPGTPVCDLKKLDRDRQELAEHFDELVFTHAAPSPEADLRRPVHAPLSAVTVAGQQGWFDLATIGRPVLIHAKAPEFRVDWKEENDVDAAFGWPQLKRELTLHTAIGRHQRRAKDKALYAYETIIPDGFRWLARVRLDGIADAETRHVVAGQLATLLAHGLGYLGKTKIRADVDLLPIDTLKAKHTSNPDAPKGRWVVTLQTPALLCDPRLLAGADRDLKLRQSCAHYWREVSEGHLIMEHFYARQCLAGGFYLWKRFQSDQPYNPWLLTEPGSVFVLRLANPGNQPKAAKLAANWLARGLPLPEWAKTRYQRNGRPGDDWRNCPYIPQNGYGEVAVNLDVHWSRRPPPEATEPIALLRTAAESQTLEDTASHSPTPECLSTVRADPAPAISGSQLKPEPVEQLPEFQDRWVIEGQLVTRSFFHLGDGRDVEWEGESAGEGRPVPLVKTVFRDARGLPCIPGSSLKAVLRAALEASGADPKDLGFMFGRGEADTEEGEGGTLEFSDARVPDRFQAPEFLHAPPWWSDKRLTAIEAGVAINRRTRTADDSKLFHQEVVPPRITFQVRITGQNLQERQIGLLLTALDAFNHEEANAPITLGADTAGGKGRFNWQAPTVSRLNKADVPAWLQNPRPLHEAAISQPSEQRLRLQKLHSIQIPAGSGKRLVFNLRLKFEGPFLVNDPSPRAKFEEHSDEKPTDAQRPPDHYPRLDVDGRPLLPESALRGAFRSQAERILRTLARSGDVPAAEAELKQPPGALTRSLTERDFELVPLGGRAFGTTGWASPLSFTGFTAAEASKPRRQEFVAIDRFTGGSAPSMKFSADVVDSPVLEGTLCVRLPAWETAGIADAAKGLLGLTLRDLIEGDISFGFGAGKGFGACRAEFRDEASRKNYEALEPALAALRSHASLSQSATH